MHTFQSQQSQEQARSSRAAKLQPTGSLGARELQRLLRARGIQPQLEVSQPSDGFEREAERVADAVMQAPDAPVQVTQRLGPATSAARSDASLAADGAEPPVLGAEVEAAIDALPGRGQALPTEVRAFMEPRFSADFSGVRVHTDAPANALAQSVNAQAFTVGRDVVFGAGHYAPHTDSGKRLLAHELTHVIQQSGAAEHGSHAARQVQRAERVGPLKVLAKGTGTINDETKFYKEPGHARSGINSKGHLAKDAKVFWLEDRDAVRFIYGTVNYPQGGSNDEYAWVSADAVTLDEAQPAPAKAAAPAKQVAHDSEKKAEHAEPQTWRSIGNLRGHPPVRSEHPHNINVVEDEDNYNMLLGIAKDSLASITSMAKSMNPTGTSVTDNRYWFAKVYQFVTEGELQFVESKMFYYPSYVLLSVIYFEKIYRDNYAAGMAGAEAHWAKAFERAEDGDNDDWTIFFYEAVWNLVDSMLAHIRFDLPRAEAWIYNTYYKPMAGVKFADFQPDFMSMSPIFDRAGERMNGVIEDNNTLFKYSLAKLTPSMAQNFYMAYFEEADMTAERADTWKRAEMLVEKGLNKDDPYTIAGGAISGSATSGKHLEGINQLDAGMRPAMKEEAEELSDTEVLAQLGKLSDADLAREKTSTRMRMLFALMRYWTDQEDEDAILRVLRASHADLVDLVDAVGAWQLLYVTDTGSHAQMRDLLKMSYYSRTTAFTAGNVIKLCANGETADWEEYVIVDILEARCTGKDFANVVEFAGADHILHSLDDDEYATGREYLRDHYYPRMSVAMAVSVISAALDETETSEYQEEMIVDILELHASAYSIITKLGENSDADGEDAFQRGLNVLKSTLDGSDQTRLETLFG